MKVLTTVDWAGATKSQKKYAIFNAVLSGVIHGANLYIQYKDSMKILDLEHDLAIATLTIVEEQKISEHWEDDFTSAEAEIDRLQDELNQADKRWGSAEAEIERLHDRLRDKNQRIEELDARIEDMEAQMTAMASYFGSTVTVDQHADQAIKMVAPTGGLDVEVQR